MASFLPGMDPTREKHAWLGDAMDAAEQSMYNYFTPAIYRLFLRQVADAQAPQYNSTAGRVPVVMPCHGGVDAQSNDISWTAAFVMIARWLLAYHGDLAIIQELWSGLQTWIARQLAQAGPDGLPDFFTYGDDGEV